MRTTLSIDDDIAMALERLRRRRNESLKALVNEALRRGLHAMKTRDPPCAAVRTMAVDLGRVRAEIDNVAEMLAVAETESFK